MSSRCAASSSTVCAGRSAAPVARACRRTSAFQSRLPAMMCLSSSGIGLQRRRPQDAKRTPATCPSASTNRRQSARCSASTFRPGFGDAVIAAPPLAGLFDPSPLDPPALFHAVERRVERGQREAEVAVRSLLDQLRNLVAVMPLVLDHGQDEDLGAALLGFVQGPAIRHGGSLYEGQLYVMCTLTAGDGRLARVNSQSIRAECLHYLVAGRGPTPARSRGAPPHATRSARFARAGAAKQHFGSTRITHASEAADLFKAVARQHTRPEAGRASASSAVADRGPKRNQEC